MALAAHFAAVSGVRRGVDASAARYTALAAYYAAENEDIQSGIDAGAAR